MTVETVTGVVLKYVYLDIQSVTSLSEFSMKCTVTLYLQKANKDVSVLDVSPWCVVNDWKSNYINSCVYHLTQKLDFEKGLLCFFFTISFFRRSAVFGVLSVQFCELCVE